MPIIPFKAMPVIYRAIGSGGDYAAFITDVRGDEVSLATFPPGGGLVPLSRIKFVPYPLDTDTGVCFPAPNPNDPVRK